MRAIVSVLRKLRDVSGLVSSRFSRGRRIALIYSEAAVDWGNQSAKAWRHDSTYIRFLGEIFPGVVFR